MTTFSDLIKATTPDQVEATLLGLLASAGFPATSWQPKSFPRTCVKAVATLYLDVVDLIPNIAKGGLNKLSTGGWLDLLSDNQYLHTRATAVATIGTWRLTNQSGSGQTITVGMWLADGDGESAHLFEVSALPSGGTLAAPNGSVLDVTVRAEKPGTAYNLPNSLSTLRMAGGVLPGVLVSNPPIGSTGTWITTAGADEENDTALQERNASKWASLAPGGADLSYVYWARTAAPNITRVSVDDAAPDGPGTLRVYLANAAGGATASEVTAVQNFIHPKRALPGRVTAVAANNVAITVSAVLYIDGANAEADFLEAVGNLSALAAAHPIGGLVYLSEISAALTSPAGVRNVVLAEPTTDTNLGTDGVPVFTANLSYVVLS